MNNYPTNLTDKQWQIIKNKVEPKDRKRKHSLREMINAMIYLTKTGCQWRMLPKEFGPWQTHDSVGAIEPIKQLQYTFPRWKRIIADVFMDREL